jgi:hypothetical protein
MKSATAILCALWWVRPAAAAAPEEGLLPPAADPAGYLARLLVNESAFPGERGYVSEENTRETMRALILVIDARIHRVPLGYSRQEVADTDSADVVDVITAGGRRGQMDGFHRGRDGRPAVAPRIAARVANLERIAARGEPDRFARLLAYARALAADYLNGAKPGPDLYAGITHIRPRDVTGCAYGWMTDQDYYHPGGDFVRIPDRMRGRLGGNRFYTLVKRPAPSGERPAAGRKPLVSPPSIRSPLSTRPGRAPRPPPRR